MWCKYYVVLCYIALHYVVLCRVVCYIVFDMWCLWCGVWCYIRLACVRLCYGMLFVVLCWLDLTWLDLDQSTHFPCRVAHAETQTCPYICLESVWRHWPSLPTIQHELDQRWAACWVGTLPCQPCSLSFRPLSPVPAVHRAERSHKEYETAPLRRIQIKYWVHNRNSQSISFVARDAYGFCDSARSQGKSNYLLCTLTLNVHWLTKCWQGNLFEYYTKWRERHRHIELGD